MDRDPYSPPTVPVADPTADASAIEPQPTKGERGLACLLLVGGALGIGLSLYLATLVLRSGPIASLIALPLVLLFVWSMFTGFRLWRGHNSGRKWATILFAMQIPILTVPGFSYEYYTGLSVKVIGGHVDRPVAFSLGSNGNLQVFDPRVTDSAYGLNLFGLAATAYLVNRRRNSIAKS
jgi:hypothetical protein